MDIYCDGSCINNPGPGAYAVIVDHGDSTSQEFVWKHPETTTNQRMELQAAIEAVRAIDTFLGEVTIFTDSKYVVKGITEWINNWLRNGWKTASKPRRPVENQDLWKILYPLASQHKITWVHVYGHADNVLNNRCDQMAKNAALSLT